MKSLPEDPPTLDVSIDALVSNQLKNDQEMGTDAKPISGEPLQENQSFRGFPRAMCPGLRKVTDRLNLLSCFSTRAILMFLLV